ncbi:hemagglutinin repeat-containing protein [Cupriavidus basilensis]|uniref:Putative large exoprotein involved in heme utilization or adhesion of ShlA/HecA/FhaA family n=1 Tax=Cupriavidus basilensis TaxID=68895 RepID=A0A0C4YE13_9BURK|nr:hemagglutinin repeat-containing protein [Cupriavidus basilensis]AJG23942.1 Putative large exoprotein involved in heme utilization or adhesion of ShlA/HecA/FhaA family [Cupriavidus basilensis]
MNKNIHRLVFNAARGMLVAAPEHAAGRGKGRQGNAGRGGQGSVLVPAFVPAFVPVLWLTALTASMMGLPVLLDQSAHAQSLPIQVDKQVPGQRPVVGVAANGVPVVNIPPPSRNGGTSVSHFIQYNVGPSGVVLNNSGANSQTRIAGWVQGNTMLGNGHASNIVVQVTQPNPSRLLGAQEIAGNRANLILANPAGLHCSGCGAINADRFTLSTGRPVFGADGSLAGFDVRGGNIGIDGQGLSSPQAQVDLLARSIQVNAQLWATHLNVVAGANQVGYETLNAAAQAGNGPAPQFALDASALSAMYSGAVRLIGTERGVGFHLGGGVTARSGDIVVDNNGDVRIVPGGRLQAEGSASLAGASIDNAGTITTRGGIAAATPGALSNSGTLAAGTDLLARAERIANSGTIGAGVDANASVTGAGTAHLAARTAIQSHGTIVSGANTRLSAPTLDLSNGKVVAHDAAYLSAAGDIRHQDARLEANAVQVDAGGTVDNRGGAIVVGTHGGAVQGANILNQDGAITSSGTLGVDAAQAVDNTGGTIAGTRATTVAAAGTVNRGGMIASVQDQLRMTGTLDNTSGKIVAGGPLDMTGDSLANTGGQVASNRDATLRIAATLDNTAGFIHAGGTLDAQAGAILNRDTLHGTGAAPKGMEGASVRLSAHAIDNAQGALRADASLDANAATLGNTGGEVASGGTAQLDVQAITNTGGLLAANQALGIRGNSLTGDGSLQSHTGDVTAILQTDFHNTGTVTAARDLNLLIEDAQGNATSDITNAGKLLAGRDADVHGRNVTNAGELSGRASSTVRADGAVLNKGLIDGGAVRILAGTTVTNIDRIYGDSVAIGAGQQLLNDINAATGQGAVIASRSGGVELGAPEIVNREHALVYSSQDLNVGRALDASGKATGQADALTNASATIEVAGSANFNVAALANRNDHFRTERTDTGTVHAFYYRLDGSAEKIDPSTAMLVLPTASGAIYGHIASRGDDLAYLGDDDYKRLLLPSARYPFSVFGPPFDWARQADGTPGQSDSRSSGPNWPVGLAMLPFAPDAHGSLEADHFVYKADDPIWDKFGMARPGALPPVPSPCPDGSPAACQTQYRAALLAYHAAKAASKPLYEALNGKIQAFNSDYQGRLVKSWTIERRETRVQDEVVVHTDPARILVGGNASFTGAVTNDKSQILVGGTLAAGGASGGVNNLAHDAIRIEDTTGTSQYTRPCGRDRCYDTMGVPAVHLEIPTQLAKGEALDYQVVNGTGTIVADKTGTGPIATAPTLTQIPLGTGAAGLLGGDVIRAVSPSLAMPDNALFKIRGEPGTPYLIETDPRFTNQRQWLSSDVMLTQLGQDPTHVLKRLGDGYYEARLVADAVMLGTGQRFVGDYTDNEAQYKALMQSGVAFGKQFHLNVGTALTADQMRALTTDIVWLVEKTVTLKDGTTQRVLVPQVYLKVRAGDLKGDGTLMAARDTVIQTDGDVKNTGTIASRNVTLMDAANIHNSGALSASVMGLSARQDINNLAGHITTGQLAAMAGRDINLTTTTASGAGGSGDLAGSRAVIAGISSVAADNATFVAGRDINTKAANIQATGSLGMAAGRDIHLGTVEVSESERLYKDAKNNAAVSRSTEIGTQVTAGKNTTLSAGRDVNATAAYVSADGALAVGAGRDINVKAGQASSSVRDEHAYQESGFLSKKSTHAIDANSQTEALGSTFSGDTVAMAAGRDLAVAGSTVAATHDVNLGAGRDLTIGTTETTSSAHTYKEETKSGFGATGSGLSYGKRAQKDTTNDNGTRQVGSLVGSTDGSVRMNAGSTLTVTGSDLIARQDITGVGADVNIEAAQNRQHHDETHEVKQSGFTLGVSGGAIGAAIGAGNKINAASQSQDGRASALWGIAAARDIADTGSALAQAGGNPLSGAAVTLSWGTSQSKQTMTQDATSHNGANVSAGGTVAFVATGVDANGNQTAGNLNITGSNIDANKVALGARHDINIVSATDTNESHSTNKSSSASVGVSYGLGPDNAGFGVSASASKAKGNSDSRGVSQTNSHVSGRESVTLLSGNDTNILGATLSGGKVIADVGGNLNIASRQDTEETRARQESISGGFSISQGGGSASVSASKGKASGSYANVSEQSGIHAGKDGFDLTVKGNTDLKGAVIASEAGKDKNNLTTGTLTWTDIANHSDYSATSAGLSAGGAFGAPSGQSNSGQASGKNTGGINPMIPQHESGSQDGLARSAIAEGTITINDQASQKQDLASLKRDTAGTNSTVGKNPDLNQVLNKQSDMMAAAQAAGEAIAKTVGDLAGAKEKQARANAKAARDAGDTQLESKYLADAQNWEEGGNYRAALHAAGGALVAGLGGGNALAGAAGAGVSSLAAPKLQALGNAVSESIDTGNAGLNEALGNVAANIAAGGVGAIVSGGSGAATAANVDRFNRQLHPDEKAKILAQANGNKAEEDRLTKAACYVVQCWAEYSVGSAEYNKNYVSSVEASGLTTEIQWVKLQKQAGLFDYTLAQRVGDAVKSDPIGVAKDGLKAVTGAVTALTGGTICGTSLVGCAAGGPMAAFGTSDAVEGVTGLTNAMLGYRSGGFNPIKYGLNEVMPVWGNTAYDGLNLTFNLLAMRAQVPLKLGLADGLARPSSIFGATTSKFNNPKLVPIINWSLPNGTAQNALLMGAGAKTIGLVNDVNNARPEK